VLGVEVRPKVLGATVPKGLSGHGSQRAAQNPRARLCSTSSPDYVAGRLLKRSARPSVHGSRSTAKYAAPIAD